MIGEIAKLADANRKVIPGVSPAAMQIGGHVAKILVAELNVEAGQCRTPRAVFTYWDKGSMATIGHSAAVAKIGRLELSGLLAW